MSRAWSKWTRTAISHELLTRVLKAIGVEEPVASDEACRLEHVIDDDTYNKINAFYEKFMKEQA